MQKEYAIKHGFLALMLADPIQVAMEEEKKSLLKTLGLVSSMGISVALAIAIGVFIGLQLDKWFGTAPWFFFIFLFFGIAAGFRNIYVIAGREIHKNDRGTDKRK